MSCSELNFQVRIYKLSYNSHDEDMITHLDHPYNITIEIDPEKNNQAFDIVIPNHNNDPGGDDTDNDEEVIDNNESTAENCNEYHVSEDHSNDEDFENETNSDRD